MKYVSIKRISIKGESAMEKFIGRKNELDALEKLYNTPGFQMTVIYGRRRIGKSTLIKEFIKEKKSGLFYSNPGGHPQESGAFGKTGIGSSGAGCGRAGL